MGLGCEKLPLKGSPLLARLWDASYPEISPVLMPAVSRGLHSLSAVVWATIAGRMATVRQPDLAPLLKSEDAVFDTRGDPEPERWDASTCRSWFRV